MSLRTRLRRRALPDATISRLPQYLRCLAEWERAGEPTVHSGELAERVGVSGAVVRRDLSYLGNYGTRGVGYPVTELRAQVTSALGLAGEQSMVVVGAGRMGSALAGYAGFADRGLRVVGLFDNDDELIGSKAGNAESGLLEILPMAELSDFIADNDVRIGVIATPGSEAQAVADELVDAGVSGILNLTAVHVSAPEAVAVRPVDLASEIQILAVHAGQQEVR